MPRYSPSPCETNRSRRRPQSFGSSSLSEPAVELRGLANGSSSAARRSSLSRSSSELVMYTSPRTSSRGAGQSLSDSGTSCTVLRLAVMSSPRSPSPRVAPRTSWQSS